jgi:hypothetical protein
MLTALLVVGALLADTSAAAAAPCSCDPLTDVSQFTTCEVKPPLLVWSLS